jgi:hypothetical protein
MSQSIPKQQNLSKVFSNEDTKVYAKSCMIKSRFDDKKTNEYEGDAEDETSLEANGVRLNETEILDGSVLRQSPMILLAISQFQCSGISQKEEG